MSLLMIFPKCFANVYKGGCGTHRTKNNSCIPRNEILKRLGLVPCVCQGKMSQVPAQHTQSSRWSFKTIHGVFPEKKIDIFSIKLNFIVCVEEKKTEHQ